MNQIVKVLQVNNVYAEKSTGKLTKQLHEGLLQGGFESVVVYGRGKTVTEEGVYRLCPEWYGKANSLISRFTGLRYGGCFLSTLRLMGMIRREKPDVVHLQCINGNFVNIYRLVAWLKQRKIRTVVSLHAEFMYTANCGHAFSCDQWKTGCRRCPDRRKATKSLLFDRTGASWKKMRAAFAGFEENCLICPVSPWTEERARQSDMFRGFSFRTVYNGVDMAVFRRREPHTGESPVILHVTAQFSPEKQHPKGGWYLTELARRIPEVTFQVAGPAQEPEDCPENLKILGVVRDQETLARLYSQADLSVLVSRAETFSMPCAESLCCGTPVVGFRAGAPEQISLPEYSAFVEFGDLDALEREIRTWLQKENLNREQIAREAKTAYSSESMIAAFLDVYRRML